MSGFWKKHSGPQYLIYTVYYVFQSNAKFSFMSYSFTTCSAAFLLIQSKKKWFVSKSVIVGCSVSSNHEHLIRNSLYTGVFHFLSLFVNNHILLAAACLCFVCVAGQKPLLRNQFSGHESQHHLSEFHFNKMYLCLAFLSAAAVAHSSANEWRVWA